MSRFVVRALAAADVEALLALQHASAGRAPRWSRAQLEAELYDPARESGHRVVVVADATDGVPHAGAGYVPAGREFFAAPSFADDAEAAALLFGELGRRAAGAEFVRVSCGDAEDAKRAGLARLGFAPTFAFLTLTRPSAGDANPGADTATPLGTRRVAVASVGLETLRDAHNAAFAGVANAPEASLDEIRFVTERLFEPASGVWLGAHGAVAGFVWVLVDNDSRGPHATIDAVAVVPGLRTFGLGRRMVSHALGAARAAGIREVRAVIASNNAASLALHRALGFTEAWRRDVWQLDLPRP